MKSVRLPGYTAYKSLSSPEKLTLGQPRRQKFSRVDAVMVVPAMQSVCTGNGRFCCYWGENGDWWGCSKQV